MVMWLLETQKKIVINLQPRWEILSSDLKVALVVT